MSAHECKEKAGGNRRTFHGPRSLPFSNKTGDKKGTLHIVVLSHARSLTAVSISDSGEGSLCTARKPVTRRSNGGCCRLVSSSKQASGKPRRNVSTDHSTRRESHNRCLRRGKRQLADTLNNHKERTTIVFCFCSRNILQQRPIASPHPCEAYMYKQRKLLCAVMFQPGCTHTYIGFELCFIANEDASIKITLLELMLHNLRAPRSTLCSIHDPLPVRTWVAERPNLPRYWQPHTSHPGHINRLEIRRGSGVSPPRSAFVQQNWP